ncbi:hypothetical protein RhiXN_03534 [Rhizoctonia solani]|uniref:Uncharacterized protein n=1 Tax=Rhizoctonia solani TaxID=456999 RepID=A0A8H8NNK0_9AGAM|nr:uncharacterized protein RhiXN_03534 [Rhizoctonia solani]QRW15533.1 hypothetical protein RhiXN_03534 [Rhizoctonia solani]
MAPPVLRGLLHKMDEELQALHMAKQELQKAQQGLLVAIDKKMKENTMVSNQLLLLELHLSLLGKQSQHSKGDCTGMFRTM